MPKLIIQPDDPMFLACKVDMDKILFLRRHLDAFMSFYEEQGKIYWFRYLVSFRDYLYKREFAEAMSSLPFCKHRIDYISDEAFMVLHKEFIECNKTKKIKSLLWDMMVVVLYTIQFEDSFSTSHSNSPFQRHDTRSAFSRLLGFAEKVSDPMFKRLLDILVVPVYIVFTGNMCMLLKHWMQAKKNPLASEMPKDIKWDPPIDWTTDGFLPNRYEKFIACLYGETLEKELDLEENFRAMVFKSRPRGLRSSFIDKNYEVLNCSCSNQKTADAYSFQKYVIRETLGKEMGNVKCNHRGDEIDDLDYLDTFSSDIEEMFDGHYECAVCSEEAKKKLLLHLAEERFRIEEEELKFQLAKRSKKKKHRSKSRNKTDRASKPYSPKNCVANGLPDVELEGAVGLAPEKSVVVDQVIKKCKEEGFTGDLQKIKENINKIEQLVKEKGCLDPEHLSLMLETGAMLNASEPSKPSKKPETTQKKAVKKQELKNSKMEEIKTSAYAEQAKPIAPAKFCYNCQKIKESDIKLKRCSLCVKENVVKIRYYCDRECQAQDWVKQHKDEHEKSLLPKASM